MESIDFLTCKETLNKWGFSNSQITNVLEKLNIGVKDLTQEKGFESIPSYFKKYEIVKENTVYHTKKYWGSWEKDIEVRGSILRIPAQFQDLKHGEIIFELLKGRYDWFDNFRTNITKTTEIFDAESLIIDIPDNFDGFTVKEIKKLIGAKKDIEQSQSKWKIYGCSLSSNKEFEIYLETIFGDLYVPIKAILNKDFSIIEKRMNEYLTWYYKNDKNKLEKALKVLESEEAKQLKEYLTEN